MPVETVGEGPRRRDAVATRQALLDAARTLMAERGVEGTSTRDVAAAAGVNQALVYRYFGSKEKLFTEAAGGAGRSSIADLVAATPMADLPRALLERSLVTAATRERDSMSGLISGMNDATVRAVLRDRIDAAFGVELAARLDGPDAALRAELLGAVLAGIALFREKIETHALRGADAEEIGTYFDLVAAVLLRSPDEAA